MISLWVQPYRAVLSARFRSLLQYRAAAIAGFGTQLFWGLIRIMVFEGFYRSTTAPQPMTWQQTLDYVWLGQAMLLLFPWNLDREIQALIRSGAVAYELVRPVDLYSLWLMRYLAMRTAPVLLRAVPQFIVAGLFFGLRPPPSMASALAWLAATGGALLLGCSISVLMTASLLWTLSGEGIVRMAPAVIYFLSGMLTPLLFFPRWFQRALNALPFRGLADLPFRLWSGNIPPANLGHVLLFQLAWTVFFVLVGRVALSRGVRGLVIQGA